MHIRNKHQKVKPLISFSNNYKVNNLYSARFRGKNTTYFSDNRIAKKMLVWENYFIFFKVSGPEPPHFKQLVFHP